MEFYTGPDKAFFLLKSMNSFPYFTMKINILGIHSFKHLGEVLFISYAFVEKHYKKNIILVPHLIWDYDFTKIIIGKTI